MSSKRRRARTPEAMGASPPGSGAGGPRLSRRAWIGLAATGVVGLVAGRQFGWLGGAKGPELVVYKSPT